MSTQPSIQSPAMVMTALPGARSSLTLLLLINLFNYIDRYVLAAVEPLIQKEFFADGDPNAEFWMGTLASAFMIAYMITSPVFGWLADRMSRWFLVGVGVILWSLASGASGLAGTFMILLLTRCCVGVGEAAYGPAAPTLISDLYPVSSRGWVLSWFYMAIPVGSALGYILGGQVAGLLDWRWAFYLVVPPGILLGVWSFLRRDPPRGQADAVCENQRQLHARDYLILLRTPSYVLNTLGMAAMTFAMGGIAFWAPKYIHHDRGQEDLAMVNTIFGGITVIAGLAATLIGGAVGDRLRNRWPGSYFLVSGIGMFIGFPLFIAFLWTPFPWAWVLVFLAVFWLFFNVGPTNTILANVTHPSMRASGFALNIFIIHALGDAVSPAIIGKIAGHAGMRTGFLAVSGMILVSGVFWLWGARYLAKDTQRAPFRLEHRENH